MIGNTAHTKYPFSRESLRVPLSANTLIHFTRSKENLKKILEENFRIYNCRESVILGGKPSEFYVPMVSFCDLPLSEVKDHISKYGNYGIGMTKAWGGPLRDESRSVCGADVQALGELQDSVAPLH